MGVNRVFKRGKTRIEVRRRWPDGTTFRRYFPNMTLARQVDARIAGAIADGSWRELKDELAGKVNSDSISIAEFSKLFMQRYCKVRMRSWKRYALSFKTLNPRLGHLSLSEFRRHHLHAYVEWRSRQVKPNTVNRDISCIKKMFSFALELGFIDAHPLVRFPLLPVQETARPVLTVEEFRLLVDAVEEPSLAAMVAVMGETGLRKSEALKMATRRPQAGCSHSGADKERKGT